MKKCLIRSVVAALRANHNGLNKQEFICAMPCGTDSYMVTDGYYCVIYPAEALEGLPPEYIARKDAPSIRPFDFSEEGRRGYRVKKCDVLRNNKKSGYPCHDYEVAPRHWFNGKKLARVFNLLQAQEIEMFFHDARKNTSIARVTYNGIVAFIAPLYYH